MFVVDLFCPRVVSIEYPTLYQPFRDVAHKIVSNADNSNVTCGKTFYGSFVTNLENIVRDDGVPIVDSVRTSQPVTSTGLASYLS